MLKEQNFNLERMDNPGLTITWREEFPTSVYAAMEWEDRVLIGGSDWDRRMIPYTKEIAEQSRGILRILSSQRDEEMIVQFPSMIYSILPLSSDRIFVGCKGTKGALNLLNREGEIIIQADDLEGQGIYNSIHDPKNQEIICTTRTGKLEFFDKHTLSKRNQIQLSAPNVRLWSIAFDKEGQVIYAGDYDGVFYKIQRAGDEAQSFTLKNIDPQNPFLKDGFGPSIWGLDLLEGGGRVVMGTRWSQILIIDSDMQVQEIIPSPASITSLIKANEEILFVGTRYGILYSFDLIQKTFREVAEDRPATQKENAIWGMSKSNSSILVSVADGIVYNISLK